MNEFCKQHILEKLFCEEYELTANRDVFYCILYNKLVYIMLVEHQ